MRKVLALVLASMLSAALRAEPIRAVTLDYPPYEFVEGGEVKGIAVDIVREALRRTGAQASFTVLPFARALEELRTGEADLMFTYYLVPGRERFSDYSREPLVEQTISLFTLGGSSIDFDGNLDRLAEHSFGLVNFSYGAVMDAFIARKTIRRVDLASSAIMNLEKLLAERFEIMPSDRWVAYYNYDLLRKSGKIGAAGLRELKPKVESFFAYVGFTKARDLTALRDALDGALRAMRADGSYATILAGWTKRLVR